MNSQMTPTKAKDIQNKVHDYIDQNYFHNDPLHISNDFTLQGDIGMDSLDMIEFAVEMEDEFHIQVTDDEIYKMKTVGDVIDLIKIKVSK